MELRNEFEYGKDGAVTIVAGVDGSDSSMHALAYAAGLARRQHARLQVVLVSPYAQGVLDPYGTVAENLRDIAVATRSWLDDTTGRVAVELDLDVTTVVRFGDPCSQLLTAAAAVHADQIVVGASTSRGHRWWGGLGGQLARRSCTPVTVVP